MGQSYVARLEQQNNDEISSHLEALDVSKDWHNNNKKLLDKIQRLESEVEFLRKQQTQHIAQIEVKENMR